MYNSNLLKMNEDFNVIIEVISVYLNSIHCKYNGEYMTTNNIRFKLYHTMKERNMIISQINLKNPYIFKIIMDTIDSILTFANEYHDDIFNDGFHFYGSRFDYPDYMFPSVRKKIKGIVADIEARFIEKKFSESLSIKSEIDDVMNGINCIGI